VYDDIGRGVRAIARGYRSAYDASTRRERELKEKEMSTPVGY